MGSVVVLAPAVGPLIGGFILTGASWRWTFWPLCILGLIILALLIQWMPEPLPPDKRHPLKISLLLKQYKSLLLNRRFILLLFAYSVIFCGFIAWLASGPFFVIQEFHYPPYVFGLFQILILSFYILANQLVKRLMESIGIQTLIRLGFSITFLGGAVASLAALFLPDYLSGLILGMAIYSFGFGLCAAPLQRLIIEASSEPMGSRMALLSTALQLLALLATALVKFSYNGQLRSLALILLATALAAALAYLLEKTAKSSTNTVLK
jgi:DHA1 family multidrug/chloramphenicol efflux transport protein-like MFS transporter